jgi:uncharacterized protein (DUF924 family)
VENFRADYVLAKKGYYKQLLQQPSSSSSSTKHEDEANDVARSHLSMLILLDQTPRNMFRGTAAMFGSDKLAQSLAHRILHAPDRADATSLYNRIKQIDDKAIMFVLLPLMHSESKALQEECCAEHELLGDAWKGNLKFAQDHRDTVVRFGRFPHRNATIGRTSTPEEIEHLKEHSGW